MTVIRYLQNPTARYPTFETNKIQLIQELSPVPRWHHVPTELNPADKASRSMKISETKKVDKWIHCNRFLWGPKEEWPKEPEGLGELLAGMFDFGSHTASSFAQDLEGQTSGDPIMDAIFARVSSWKKLTKVVAWWLKLQA
jgi:hypothetical protein